MNMRVITLRHIAEDASIMSEAQRNWRIAAIALLSIRFMQGFIYWGGGSRRFIYAPSKLDPSAPS
jgi:thiosulfate dehydrogenase (quinone)